MKKSELLTKVRFVARTQHKSYATEKAYVGWINRFVQFSKSLPKADRPEAKVRAFLESIAPHSAASTQNQALNAIAFLFNQVLEKPLGSFGDWAKAERPDRLPVWLTREEWARLRAHLSGTPAIMADICYGCGLRLMEVTRLRVKDVDLSAGVLMVRDGKGAKDRVTCLPHALRPVLQRRIEDLRDLWLRDQADKLPGVYLPEGLARKYPNAGREFPWQWVFPARSSSLDRRTGVRRRHHLCDNTLQKAVAKAVKAARLSKRVTTHSLRHSFATELLQNGVDVVRIQELLGHAKIETTSIYLHCVPKFAAAITSPLDFAAAEQATSGRKIVPMRAVM